MQQLGNTEEDEEDKWVQAVLKLPNARVSGPLCSIPNAANNSCVANLAILICCRLSVPQKKQGNL